VRAELDSYGHGLVDKPEIVALTKADALTDDQVKEQVARLKRAARKTPLVISAHSGAGMKEALRAVLALVARAEAAETKAAEPAEAWHP
jgi:GTPase